MRGRTMRKIQVGMMALILTIALAGVGVITTGVADAGRAGCANYVGNKGVWEAKFPVRLGSAVLGVRECWTNRGYRNGTDAWEESEQTHPADLAGYNWHVYAPVLMESSPHYRKYGINGYVQYCPPVKLLRLFCGFKERFRMTAHVYDDYLARRAYGGLHVRWFIYKTSHRGNHLTFSRVYPPTCHCVSAGGGGGGGRSW